MYFLPFLNQLKDAINIQHAIAPMPISSDNVTVERGTSKTVPIQAQRTFNPCLNARVTPIAPVVPDGKILKPDVIVAKD